MRFKQGFVQLPIVIGLVIIAIVLPITTTVVKQRQELRKEAGGSAPSCPGGTQDSGTYGQCCGCGKAKEVRKCRKPDGSFDYYSSSCVHDASNCTDGCAESPTQPPSDDPVSCGSVAMQCDCSSQGSTRCIGDQQYHCGNDCCWHYDSSKADNSQCTAPDPTAAPTNSPGGATPFPTSTPISTNSCSSKGGFCTNSCPESNRLTDSSCEYNYDVDYCCQRSVLEVTATPIVNPNQTCSALGGYCKSGACNSQTEIYYGDQRTDCDGHNCCKSNPNYTPGACKSNNEVCSSDAQCCSNYCDYYDESDGQYVGYCKSRPASTSTPMPTVTPDSSACLCIDGTFQGDSCDWFRRGTSCGNPTSTPVPVCVQGNRRCSGSRLQTCVCSYGTCSWHSQNCPGGCDTSRSICIVPTATPLPTVTPVASQCMTIDDCPTLSGQTILGCTGNPRRCVYSQPASCTCDGQALYSYRCANSNSDKQQCLPSSTSGCSWRTFSCDNGCSRGVCIIAPTPTTVPVNPQNCYCSSSGTWLGYYCEIKGQSCSTAPTTIPTGRLSPTPITRLTSTPPVTVSISPTSVPLPTVSSAASECMTADDCSSREGYKILSCTGSPKRCVYTRLQEPTLAPTVAIAQVTSCGSHANQTYFCAGDSVKKCQNGEEKFIRQCSDGGCNNGACIMSLSITTVTPDPDPDSEAEITASTPFGGLTTEYGLNTRSQYGYTPTDEYLDPLLYSMAAVTVAGPLAGAAIPSGLSIAGTAVSAGPVMAQAGLVTTQVAAGLFGTAMAGQIGTDAYRNYTGETTPVVEAIDYYTNLAGQTGTVLSGVGPALYAGGNVMTDLGNSYIQTRVNSLSRQMATDPNNVSTDELKQLFQYLPDQNDEILTYSPHTIQGNVGYVREGSTPETIIKSDVTYSEIEAYQRLQGQNQTPSLVRIMAGGESHWKSLTIEMTRVSGENINLGTSITYDQYTEGVKRAAAIINAGGVIDADSYTNFLVDPVQGVSFIDFTYSPRAVGSMQSLVPPTTARASDQFFKFSDPTATLMRVDKLLFSQVR